jgi:hypothetical protein
LRAFFLRVAIKQKYGEEGRAHRYPQSSGFILIHVISPL